MHDLASFVLVICLIVDYVFLITWVDRNIFKKSAKWQLGIRHILLLTTVAAIQLWFLFAYLKLK